MAFYPNEKTKIEMTNVEDMKDIANEFDILYFHEVLEKKHEKEQQYELNKNLIRQDLDILKNEIMDRDNLRKLREIFEFVEKNDPNYYLNSDKMLYRDVIVEILNNFFDDLANPSNNLIDYNLIREALKFVTYMEESKAYCKFFEIYNTQKNLKNKLREHENSLLGKLNHIVKVKQKKRKQEINKKKKFLNEEISKEFSRRNVTITNSLLEHDYYNKKEEDMVDSIKKLNNNFDLILNEPNASKPIIIKNEVKTEPSSSKNKVKKETQDDILTSNNSVLNNSINRTIDIENQILWNTVTDNHEQMISDSEEEKNLDKKNDKTFEMQDL